MAKTVTAPWGAKFADASSWRNWMTYHLLRHPDHAHAYPRGHDFVLRSTISVAREHEYLHSHLSQSAQHEHDRPWHVLEVLEKEEDMKTLELKVTVRALTDPDAELVKILSNATDSGLATLMSRRGGSALTVTKLERADGQEIGLEAKFEEYWRDNCCEGDHGSADEKWAARHAFFYAVKLMKEKK